MKQRKLALRHRTRPSTNASATPAPSDVAPEVAPTSPLLAPTTARAKTTKRARLSGRTNSGYVVSFFFRARLRAMASLSDAPRCGWPSRCTADTKVVSTANCAPPKSGKQSTTTSSLRLSWALGTPRSMSRTRRLVATRPPASLHTLAAALSKENPLLPKTPDREQAARWWPRCSTWRPVETERQTLAVFVWRRRRPSAGNAFTETRTTLFLPFVVLDIREVQLSWSFVSFSLWHFGWSKGQAKIGLSYTGPK